jgi:hypothetical protein
MGLIEKYYGSPRTRNAVTDNINSMVAVGLPIKKEGKKFVFDMSEMLTVEDLALIENCIMQNVAIDSNTKTDLTDKVKMKFKNLLV